MATIDLVRVEHRDVAHVFVLAKLDAGLGCARSEPAHEPRGLDRAAARMHDHAAEAAGEHAGEVVEPVDVEAVLPQRLVLRANLLPLLLVGGEAVAADLVQRVPRQLGEPVGLGLRPAPQLPRLLAAVRLARDVVAGRPAREREAAVAAARALGDGALVVDADGPPRFGQPQRGRAAGDARADDRDVDAAVVLRRRAGRELVFEPVGMHDTVDATPPGR